MVHCSHAVPLYFSPFTDFHQASSCIGIRPPPVPAGTALTAARVQVTSCAVSPREPTLPTPRPPPPRRLSPDSPSPATVFLGSSRSRPRPARTCTERYQTQGQGSDRALPAHLCPPETQLSSSSRLLRHPASLPHHWLLAEVSLSSLHPFSQSERGSRSLVRPSSRLTLRHCFQPANGRRAGRACAANRRAYLKSRRLRLLLFLRRTLPLLPN